MNSYELKMMLQDSGWEYSEGQYEAMASKLKSVVPYHAGVILLEFRTAPVPDKLVNAIFNNQPKQKKSCGCFKCDKGDIKVAKLIDIPSRSLSTPILYPKMYIPCPFCQDKTRFVNYIKKAIELDKILYVIAYLDISDKLNNLAPVILEVISNENFNKNLTASRKIWNAPITWCSTIKCFQ